MKSISRSIVVGFFLMAFIAPDFLFAEDQTILLDESLIVGTQLGEAVIGQKKRIAGPALSTALRWEGDKNDELDIPKEILDHLTRSDLSFFKNRNRDRDFLEDESE